MNTHLVSMLSTHALIGIGEAGIVPSLTSPAAGLCLTARRSAWVAIANAHALRTGTLALPPRRSAGQHSCPLLCSCVRWRSGANQTLTHADHPKGADTRTHTQTLLRRPSRQSAGQHSYAWCALARRHHRLTCSPPPPRCGPARESNPKHWPLADLTLTLTLAG